MSIGFSLRIALAKRGVRSHEAFLKFRLYNSDAVGKTRDSCSRSTKKSGLSNPVRDHIMLSPELRTVTLAKLDAQRSGPELVDALHCHKMDIVDTAIFNRAMQKCAEFKDYRSVQNVMDILLSHEYLLPDVLSFNIYIHHMALSDAPEKCVSALHRMINEYDLNPDHITFSAVIKSLRFRNLCVEAEKCWKMMRNQYGVEPHDVLYCEMISCYSKAHRIEDATRIFNEYLERVDFGSLEADVAVFNAFLNGFSRIGDMKGIERTMDLFQRYGVELTVNSISDIMRGCIRANQYLQCVQVAQQWMDRGQAPNDQIMAMKCVALSKLIALCHEGFDEKYKIYRRLKHVLDSELAFYGLTITPRIAKTQLDGAIMLYPDDWIKVLPVFESLEKRELLRWTYLDRRSGREYVDLHLFTVMESKFILWYAIHFKLERFLGEDEKEMIVIVGKGKHSPGKESEHSTLGSLISKDLLSWNPPIRCKTFPKNKGKLVIARKDLVPYSTCKMKVE